MERPNIVLIMTDMHRQDALGCYGNRVIRTPNLDGIAERGARFTRCYVQSPACMPSRATIMTGKYPHSHGVTRNLKGLPSCQTTFMDLLSRAGYHTAAVGKMHMMPKYGPFGFGYLDIVDGKRCARHPYNDNYTIYLERIGKDGLERLPPRRTIYDAYTSPIGMEDYIDSYIGRKAIRYLKEVRREPFFLWISFSGPHFPFDPPVPYDRMYDPREVEPPRIDVVDLREKRRLHPEFAGLGEEVLAPENLRRAIAHYYGCISLIDHWVGRILRTFEEEGIEDRTIVVFTSDHGALLGEHGLAWHGLKAMYDEQVRVPLIMRGPGIPSGTVMDALVESLDLTATFLEWAGVEEHPGMAGGSLIPIVRDEDPRGRRTVHCEGCVFEYPLKDGEEIFLGTERRIMHLEGKWKYIYSDEEEYQELYNLKEDPEEKENLAGEKGYSDLIAKFKEDILKWLIGTSQPSMGEVHPIEDFALHDASPHRMPEKKRPPGLIYAEP